MEKRYDIYSPDGIPIHPEKTYTKDEVMPAFEEWKKRFEFQGFYSSVRFGRIPLEDLEDFCELKEVKLVTQ